MEDHSLTGYLKRRSTEELKAILAFCLQDTGYADSIAEVKNVLRERGLTEFSSEPPRPRSSG